MRKDNTDLTMRVRTLVYALGEGALEREEAIALSLLSAMSGESIFLLGLPGVGKSMIARRLKMAFRDAKCFEYLMSRFSTPDEIFGPVSISKLKDSGTYERVVDGYLPTADVVFLDEIWKAGPAIQNSLLTAINEKIFHNGGRDIRIPVKGIIAASNELPAEGEGLEALWERFLIRYVVQPIKDDEDFLQLLNGGDADEPEISRELPFSEEEYLEIFHRTRYVGIPDDILMLMAGLRKSYIERARKVASGKGDTDDEALIPYVSDRRWKKIAGILRTSALLNGRDSVNLSDCLLLEHMIWDKDIQTSYVQKDIADAVCKCLVHYCVRKEVNGRKTEQVDFYSPDGGLHYIIYHGKERLKISAEDYSHLTPVVSGGRFTDDGRIVLCSGSEDFLIKSVRPGTVTINDFTYYLAKSRQPMDEDGKTDIEISVLSSIKVFKSEIEDNLFLRRPEDYPFISSGLKRLSSKG